MLTLTTVILFLIIGNDITCGFRTYKYSRSVDTSQFSAQTPCPSVFQYQNDQNGNLVGAVKIDQADADGRVQLDIELSVGNSVQGYNGKIILAEERQKVINDIMNRKPIFYRVLFPAWQNIPPRVTKIVANGNIICSGPRIPIQMVPVLTTINLQHKLSLGVTPLASPDPSIASSTFDNLPDFTQGNTLYPFDVRVDRLPVVPNNIFTDNFRPDSVPNSFPNVNNPFNFNPSPDRPANGRPSPSTPVQGGGGGGINPQNPFLNPSTPEPLNGDGDGPGNSNPFFNPRTDPPSVQQSTGTPPRGGASSGTITGDLNDVCGRPIPTNSLIVNGQSVPRGAYPWLVAIFKQQEIVSVKYICSGSLISERHVVTAAHCVKVQNRRVKANEIVCVLGKLDLKKWIINPGEKMLEPESIVVHPNYEVGKANADIAVLTFADTISFSNTIMPVCLWQGSSDLNRVVGNVGTVVGWGRDEYGESTAEPRQVNMPIVDQYECLKGSSPIAGQALFQITSNNTFCAGFRNGSGPCNGDSGSAFLLRKNGIFYLRGIVSTALSETAVKVCNLQEYVVFTDASKYLDWLRRIIKQN